MIMNLASQNAAESVDRIVNGVSKNILIPTLGTITKNGITCTNNGDGTYTLNGTASADAEFITCKYTLKARKKYKLVGCPKGGSDATYFINPKAYNYDIGDGRTLTRNDDTDWTNDLLIIVKNGTTVSNLVFKPMLTTDLTVTYDDFEPQYKSVSKLTTDIEDLKYLGWTVPKEMPIQNYISDDGVFHQRVGRVDLGTLSWGKDSGGSMYSQSISNTKITLNLFIAKSYKVETVAQMGDITSDDKSIAINATTLYINDSDYTNATAFKTAMQGVYLYYELANEITITRQKIDYIDASADVIFGDVPESEFNRLRTSCEKIGNLVIFSVTTRETVTTSPDSYLFILPFKPIKQNLINDYYLLDTDGKLRYTVFGGTTINLLEFRFSYFTND